MAKSNTFSANLFKLLFQNIAIPNIGDATGLRASTTEGNIYMALFTTIPTATTNGVEASYAGYSRLAIPRNAINIEVGITDPITLKIIDKKTFGTSTVTAPDIVGAGLCFTIGGNCEFFGNFVNPIVVINGTIPTIPALNFKIISG